MKDIFSNQVPLKVDFPIKRQVGVLIHDTYFHNGSQQFALEGSLEVPSFNTHTYRICKTYPTEEERDNQIHPVALQNTLLVIKKLDQQIKHLTEIRQSLINSAESLKTTNG